MKYTPEEVARLLANRPNQPHYIEAMIRRCIDAAMPSAEPVAWIEVRDDGEEPDLTADPLWAKHYPGKWLPLFLHPSPADEAVRRDAERWRLVAQFMQLEDVGDDQYCLGLTVDHESLEEMVTVQAARLDGERRKLEWADVQGPEDSPKTLPPITLEEAIDAALAAQQQGGGE